MPDEWAAKSGPNLAREFLRHHGAVGPHGVGARAAQAGHVPRVQDLPLRAVKEEAAHHGIARGVLQQLQVAVEVAHRGIDLREGHAHRARS